MEKRKNILMKNNKLITTLIMKKYKFIKDFSIILLKNIS